MEFRLKDGKELRGVIVTYKAFFYLDLKAIMKNVREGLTSEETKVFYIAVGVACAVIFIMAMSVGILHVNSIPKPDKESERYKNLSTCINLKEFKFLLE